MFIRIGDFNENLNKNWYSYDKIMYIVTERSVYIFQKILLDFIIRQKITILIK